MSRIRTIAALVALAALTTCGTKKQQESKAPEGMYSVSLAGYGKPFSIWVPDTSGAHFKITEMNDGALNVISGPDFGMSIYEQGTDLVLKKDDITNDEVNKLRTFIADAPSSIMWESAITDPEFHFVLNKNINGTEYSFQDIAGMSFSAEGVKTMYNSANEATGITNE